MFAEQAFDVKHLAPSLHVGRLVTPPREDRGMPLAPTPVLASVAAPGCAAPPPAVRVVRLPEAVYRRRRVAAAAVASAILTLVLAVGRPDQVPVGEANPWPSAGDVSLSTDLPGVYVVQPGDTLWDIARALAPDRDPRAVVHELADTAGGAALEPGQRIVIAEVPGLATGSDWDRGPHQGSGQRAAAEPAGSER